jgi:hypothetical protein
MEQKMSKNVQLKIILSNTNVRRRYTFLELWQR